jgi:predicted acyltransferase
VEWVGCSLHDLIQPSFSFLVGVALPFSIASRRARGQSFGQMSLHAWLRGFILILLGVALRSTHARQTNWTFEDTLSQIGLGYGLLFLLGFRPVRDQWIALATILVGYWLAFALCPLPTPDFDYATVRVSGDWLKDHGLSGLAAHWQKNSNAAWAFDTWFLNLFPREKVFIANGGGYATLSFIPTLGTMVLGLIAGGVLRCDRPAAAKLRWFAVAGVIGLGLGWLLNATGVCPNVKRIWTPAWVLFSGGWCFLLLAAFYGVVDVAGHKKAAFPLMVIGMNSIAAYCIAHLFDAFVFQNLITHLGPNFFKFAGQAFEPLLHGAAVLLVFWLILFWMYRRKMFLRI